MKTVLFACVHNAGRSQMAAAFFNQYANANKARAISAGTEPSEKVHPEVLISMNELMIDLSNIKPNQLTSALAETAHLLVTMGCGEKCPYIKDLKIIEWQLDDPKGKTQERVRIIRDEIKQRIIDLIELNHWA